MENIAVFYGGKSVEHEVSIITGLQVLDNIDQVKYKVFPVYVDKNGAWWKVKHFMNKKAYKTLDKQKKQKLVLKPGQNAFFIEGLLNKKVEIDAVINCCHGTFGEDGALQGVFESLNIAYSSCDVGASAVCMNKIIMKQLFEHHGFNTPKWLYFKKGEQIDFKQVESSLEYPIFVKPANLGSSVGISKCENVKQLKQAIEVAFSFDAFVILEQGVKNLKEINCSVQKIDGVVCASELEQPINWAEFLTYENKYITKSKGGQKSVLGKVEKKLKQQIEELSIKAYKNFFLDGVIRIDYLYDQQANQLYINEINTIPGSLSFYLWKPKGLTFQEHITNQITNAKEKFLQKQQNITQIPSTLLDL